MLDLDKWQEVFSTLQRNKLRTFMTAAGVFWGIFMLIVMLGFGRGLEFGVTQNMMGTSANSVYVWAERTSMPYEGLQPGRNISFDNGDVPALAALPGIEHLAPRLQLGGYREGNNVARGEKTGNFSVMGDTPQFAHVQPMNMVEGRFLNEIDLDQRRKVAVIGKHVYDVLFDRGESPIGGTIKIRGVYFQVVGYFHPVQTGDRGERVGQTIFIPFTTFQQAFNYPDRIGWFALTGKPDVSAAKLEQEVRATLAERHKIHPKDRAAIGSFNAAEEFGKIQWLFVAIKGFIWFVGVMTLLAGVLGVSNIMLIVVKERTREIGVRKALGATPRSVISLIMQESIVLTALAGYLGMVAGVGALELAAYLSGGGSGMFANPNVDFDIAVISTLILVASGAIAGVIPARHAASIRPVVALRAE